MIYNTRAVKNISDEPFVGKYGGVPLRFEPAEERFLPSHIAEHVANQLQLKMTKKDKHKVISRPSLDKILGPVIETKDSTKLLTLKEVIEQHEVEFEKTQEDKKKEELITKEKALDIAKKDVRTTTRQPENGDDPNDKGNGTSPPTTDGQVLDRVPASTATEEDKTGAGDKPAEERQGEN